MSETWYKGYYDSTLNKYKVDPVDVSCGSGDEVTINSGSFGYRSPIKFGDVWLYSKDRNECVEFVESVAIKKIRAAEKLYQDFKEREKNNAGK